MPDASDRRSVLRSEFERAAPRYSQRTKGRFDNLGAAEFSGIRKGDSVLEVGSGTGHFLALFEGVAERLVGVDLTWAMLEESRNEHAAQLPVLADGNRLPFSSQSFDLVTCAQMLHHVWEPLPLLKEMRRVVRSEGRVLVVDQVAPESYEQTAFMNQLEALRDPSHATSRPPSAMKIVVQAAGLEILDERIVAGENPLSNWMWPGEYPEGRIEKVREFIEKFGHETGMEWRREGDDWVYTFRRIMLLASR